MDCSARLSCGMVVLLVMTGCSLFHIFYGAWEERCFEYMCAVIGQDVVLSISSGWCDVGGGWNAG